MNAFEIPGLRYSLPAGAAVARHRFITVTADSVAKQADASSSIIGASMNAVVTDKGVTAAQQIVEIADGIVVVEAAGAITAGSRVTSDAEGKAIAYVEPGAEEPKLIVAGVALTDATGAGSLVTVKIS